MSGPGLWLTPAPTPQTEFLEQPFYVRTSVSFLMWQHVRGRAQLPPLMDCLPCIVSPLNNSLYPTSPGKPGLCEGGRQSRDTVRWGVGGQEGRQWDPGETLWLLLFPSQLPLHLPYRVMEKMVHRKKSSKSCTNVMQMGEMWVSRPAWASCQARPEVLHPRYGSYSGVAGARDGQNARATTLKGGTMPCKIFPAGPALALRPGTGSWWPRHCLLTSLWPGSPGQEAPVRTAHPCEGCPRQATHCGAI